MATTADTAKRPGRPSLIERFRRLSTPFKIVSALVAFSVAVVGLVFLIFPQLEPKLPPEIASATFEDVWVDPGVTLGQYLERALLSKETYSAEQLTQRGVLVTFDTRFEGYGDKGLPIRWYVLDKLGNIVSGRDKHDVLNVDRNNATVSTASSPRFRGHTRRTESGSSSMHPSRSPRDPTYCRSAPGSRSPSSCPPVSW